MKQLKFTMVMALCIFALTGVAQSRLNFNSGQLTKTTQVIPTRSVEYASDGVIVTYTIPTADEIPASDGSNAIIWAIQGFTNNTGEGNPAVPMRNDIFSFEGSANISVELIEENHRDYMVNIAPFADPEQKEGSGVMKPYEGFFPEEPIFLRGKEEYRGNDISYVAVCPVQYDYENSIARAYTKLVYKISYAESPMKAQRRTPGGESGAPGQFSGVNTFANVAIPLVKSEEENPILKSSGSGNIPEIPEDYLIITSLACRPAAEKLAQWKRILGYNVTVSARLTWREANIKSAITNFYSSSINPTYVLFLGNATMLPPQSFIQYAEIDDSGTEDNGTEYVTDYKYMCMGGEDDHLADLIFSRIPANDITDAYTAVDKIIRYEQGTEITTSCMGSAAHIIYFEENSDSKGEENSQATRTSEEIRNFLSSAEGKVIERLYYKDTNVVPQYYCSKILNIYRSANKEPIPAELNSLWISPYNTTMRLMMMWQREPLYILYIGHSNNYGWLIPSFSISNLSGINKLKNPPFLFSMSCEVGGFDKEKCLAKELICQKGASVNVVSNTSKGWKGFQEILAETIIDCLFPTHKMTHYFEMMVPPAQSSVTDTISSAQNPTFKRFSVATVLEQSKNYIVTWLTNTGGHFDQKGEKKMLDTRYGTENFGDPTIIMPNNRPVSFSEVQVTRSSNTIYISGVDFSKAKVSFYNPNTGELMKYMNFASSPFYTDVPEDWVVCVKGDDMIPFVDFGENAQIDVTPTY